MTPLTDLTPLDESVVRTALGPVVLDGETFRPPCASRPRHGSVQHLRSWLYQAPRVAGLENVSALAQGETILGRFLIFGTEPDMDRLVPPTPGTPLPPGPRLSTATGGRRSRVLACPGTCSICRRAGHRMDALTDSTRPGRMSAEGLADLLWAVMMKPEFQLIF